MSNPFAEDTEHISVAIALGAEIGAIEGSFIYEVLLITMSPKEIRSVASHGYYGDMIGAQNAAIDWMFTQTEWFTDLTPWGKRPRATHPSGAPNVSDDLVVWNAARKEWFRSKTYEEISKWYEEDVGLVTFLNPKAHVKIVSHVVKFSKPIEYPIQGRWQKSSS